MGNNYPFTLHPECLPHTQALSKYQLSLKAYLEEAIPKNFLISELFFENLVRALVLFGDCRGLAHICRDGGGTVICRWLRSEITYSFDTRQQESHIRKQILILIDQIDFALLALREDPQWHYLFEAPRPSRNRLSHFQLAISGSSAYSLVAHRLHRGISSKTKQLRHLDTVTFNERLGGFVRPLIRIVENIPVSSIRKNIRDYGEGEFDDLIETVIYALPRLAISSTGRSTYAQKTIRKFYSTWITAFYGVANEKVFVRRRHHPGRASHIDPGDRDRAEELPESHPLRKAFLSLADEQTRLEDIDLGTLKHRSISSKVLRNLRNSGIQKIHKGKAATLFVPSKTMPGVLSLTGIAMLMEGVDRSAEFLSEEEYLAARVLIDLLLHTGRRPEWLLTLQIGNKPTSIWETMQPRWVIGSPMIYHVPKIYLSPPADASHNSTVMTTLNEVSAAELYERTNKIYRIPLAHRSACLMQALLRRRDLIIDRNTKAAVCHDYSKSSGPLFIMERDHDLVPIFESWLESLLSFLTAHIQEHIPGHQNLRASHFSRSFDGFYASLGVRGVYRYYISGRAGRLYEMPLRYSRVSLKDVAAEYGRAYDRFVNLIAVEAGELFGKPKPVASQRDRVPTPLDQNIEDAYFGSTHVPSRAILRAIMGSLRADVDQAKIRSQKENRISALTGSIAVALGLFNGLRPFEVTRLNHRSIDLDSRCITVRGKARSGNQVYRCLPLLPWIANLFDDLFYLLGEKLAPGSKLFSLLGTGTRCRVAMSTKHLDQILECAAVAAGWTSGPIFYSLRRRFRTDMLSSGMDEPNINFLMGHQIVGQEVYSIYSDHRYENLREQYLEAAWEMSLQYGFPAVQE